MSIQNTQSDDLGANHYMDSTVMLNDDGTIDGTTRTRTGTWLGGFTGGVQLLFNDVNNIVIGESNIHTFGVDGTIIGRNDRTSYWGEDISSEPFYGRGIAGFAILQFWAPRYSAINIIVGRAVQIGQQVIPLLQDLKNAGLIK